MAHREGRSGTQRGEEWHTCRGRVAHREWRSGTRAGEGEHVKSFATGEVTDLATSHAYVLMYSPGVMGGGTVCGQAYEGEIA